MNEREQISALVDGELLPAERDALLARMEREPVLADTWRRYNLSHAALQHEAPSAVDLSARVMAALDEEPALLAPRALVATRQPLWRQGWARAAGGFAVAASVALGVALLWQQSVPTESQAEIGAIIRDGSHPQVLVTAEAAGGSATETAVPQVALNDNDRENAYMLAHAEYSERGIDDGIMPYARVAGQSEDQ